MDTVIGKPMDRVDGRVKVTGKAKYAYEFPVANIAYMALVQSTVANGRVTAIDTSAAEASPGVVKVITCFNMPALSKMAATNSQRPLLDTEIVYSGQTIALVVAETFEQAEHAAGLVKVEYERQPPNVPIEGRFDEASPSKDNFGDSGHTERGDVTAGLAQAATKIEETYYTPNEHHNPMEPHATIAYWEGEDKVTLYDSTQGVVGDQHTIAGAFGLSPKNVRVMSPYLGGGFGCKGASWPHVRLCVLAARESNRPVKVALSRKQMFSSNGHREETFQKNTFATNAQNKLIALRHDMHGSTSIRENFLESTGLIHQMLYSCPNVEIDHKLVKCNLGAPTYMRAPGEASGSFALETAMDELALACKMDPLEFRLLNYAERDENENKPFSSKNLRECYSKAAEAFRWSKRNPEPGSMRNGRLLVGWGMATASYPANYWNSACKARMNADGSALVQLCSQDIGTGSYTIFTQIAAEALGIDPGAVKVELADSSYPPGPLSAGSNSAATAGSAVLVACQGLRQELEALAASLPRAMDAAGQQGRALNASGLQSLLYRQILATSKKPFIEKEISIGSGEGPPAGPPPAVKWVHDEYSKHAFGAHFCEIHIDPDLKMMRVARWVAAFAVGRILNAKTLTSQLIGGIVWGIGMGLLEESVPDITYGRFVNSNLAEYHVPVNLDVPDIEVILVPEEDRYVSPVGAKGAGEIGITGAAAAICNAVYHATGRRVRDLPITLDKLI